ncbi:hypothetical protein D7V90_17400 [bacterium 1xD42-87]|nr:hypothetical protein D7V90_17400 [bacterium 1xD42-87]
MHQIEANVEVSLSGIIKKGSQKTGNQEKVSCFFAPKNVLIEGEIYAVFLEPEKQGRIVEMWITGYGAMENAIHSTWKSQSAAFPRPANSVSHSPKRAASYPHSHTADCYGKRPFPTCHS